VLTYASRRIVDSLNKLSLYAFNAIQITTESTLPNGRHIPIRKPEEPLLTDPMRGTLLVPVDYGSSNQSLLGLLGLSRRDRVFTAFLPGPFALPFTLWSRRSGFPFLPLLVVFHPTSFLVPLLAQRLGFELMPVSFDTFQPAMC
jgi:hypothetical protein